VAWYVFETVKPRRPKRQTGGRKRKAAEALVPLRGRAQTNALMDTLLPLKSIIGDKKLKDNCPANCHIGHLSPDYNSKCRLTSNLCYQHVTLNQSGVGLLEMTLERIGKIYNVSTFTGTIFLSDAAAAANNTMTKPTHVYKLIVGQHKVTGVYVYDAYNFDNDEIGEILDPYRRTLAELNLETGIRFLNAINATQIDFLHEFPSKTTPRRSRLAQQPLPSAVNEESPAPACSRCQELEAENAMLRQRVAQLEAQLPMLPPVVEYFFF